MSTPTHPLLDALKLLESKGADRPLTGPERAWIASAITTALSGFDELQAAAKAALDILDSFGPDADQEDDELVRARAALRTALGTPPLSATQP